MFLSWGTCYGDSKTSQKVLTHPVTYFPDFLKFLCVIVGVCLHMADLLQKLLQLQICSIHLTRVSFEASAWMSAITIQRYGTVAEMSPNLPHVNTPLNNVLVVWYVQKYIGRKVNANHYQGQQLDYFCYIDEHAAKITPFVWAELIFSRRDFWARSAIYEYAFIIPFSSVTISAFLEHLW